MRDDPYWTPEVKSLEQMSDGDKHSGLNYTTLSKSTACTVKTVMFTALFSGTEAEYGVAMNCGLTSLLSNTVMVTVTISVNAGEPSRKI